MTQQWVIRKKIELEFSKWLNHNDLTSWLYLVGRNKEIKVMSVKEPYLFSDLIKICRATVHPTTRTSTPTTNSSIATFTCLASGSSQCQRTGQWRSKSGVIWVSWFFSWLIIQNDHSRRPTITGMGTLHDSRAGATCTPISTCNCEIIFYTNLSDTTPSRTRKNTPPPPLENTRTPYQRHHSPPPKNAVIYVNNVIESALLSLPLLYYMIRRRISPIWICRHTMYHPCLLIILNAIS